MEIDFSMGNREEQNIIELSKFLAWILHILLVEPSIAKPIKVKQTKAKRILASREKEWEEQICRLFTTWMGGEICFTDDQYLAR